MGHNLQNAYPCTIVPLIGDVAIAKQWYWIIDTQPTVILPCQLLLTVHLVLTVLDNVRRKEDGLPKRGFISLVLAGNGVCSSVIR
jgi:hypothetical protein